MLWTSLSKLFLQLRGRLRNLTGWHQKEEWKFECQFHVSTPSNVWLFSSLKFFGTHEWIPFSWLVFDDSNRVRVKLRLNSFSYDTQEPRPWNFLRGFSNRLKKYPMICNPRDDIFLPSSCCCALFHDFDFFTLSQAHGTKYHPTWSSINFFLSRRFTPELVTDTPISSLSFVSCSISRW